LFDYRLIASLENAWLLPVRMLYPRLKGKQERGRIKGKV
jgi:hypothetical protein